MLLNVNENVEYHIVPITKEDNGRIFAALNHKTRVSQANVFVSINELKLNIENVIASGLTELPPEILKLVTPPTLGSLKHPMFFEYKVDSYFNVFNRHIGKYELKMIFANQGGMRGRVSKNVQGYYHVIGAYSKCTTIEAQWQSILRIIKSDYALIYQTKLTNGNSDNYNSNS